MKEGNEVTYNLDYVINIDGHKIAKITFDPLHINKGWDKEASDYREGERSSYSPDEIASMFEELSSKSFDVIEKTIEKVVKRGVECVRYTFMTDIKDPNGDMLLFQFVVDIFSKDFIPPYVLVTMYEPDKEEV